MFRQIRSALYLVAAIALMGFAALAAPPGVECEGGVCKIPAAVCWICGESPCKAGCVACELPADAGGPAPKPVGVVLFTADGCPPCVEAAKVAQAAADSGVEVTVVKVPLGSRPTPAWYPLDAARSVTGPRDASAIYRLSRGAILPESDPAFSR